MVAQAIIREGMKAVAAGMNPMDLKRGIDKAVTAAVGELKNISKPCSTSKEIAQVGSISANSDDAIGEGKPLDNGTTRAPKVKVGDKVLFGKYAGTEVKLDGTEYLVVKEDDIFAVLG